MCVLNCNMFDFIMNVLFKATGTMICFINYVILLTLFFVDLDCCAVEY